MKDFFITEKGDITFYRPDNKTATYNKDGQCIGGSTREGGWYSPNIPDKFKEPKRELKPFNTLTIRYTL